MVVGSNRTQGNFLYTATYISFDESAEKVIKIMFDWLSNIHFMENLTSPLNSIQDSFGRSK